MDGLASLRLTRLISAWLRWHYRVAHHARLKSTLFCLLIASAFPLDVTSTSCRVYQMASFAIEEPALDGGPPRSVAKPGLSHIAFEVDDVGREFDRLDGVLSFHAPPLVMPSGGVFAYGRDPDGNVVELLQLPK